MTDHEPHAKNDALPRQLDGAPAAPGSPDEPVKADHAAAPERLTAADVHATAFAITNLAAGYSIEQVDTFMSRAAAELALLTEERDTARRERAALSTAR